MSNGENMDCCVNCFSEPEIRSFMEGNETTGNCDYCESSEVNVRDVEEVGDFIFDGILRYYEDAAEHVGYESAEGGFQLSTYSLYEILLYELNIFSGNLDDPSRLAEELIRDDGTPYVRRDPYGSLPGEPDEIDYWERFCEIVKDEQRFSALTILNPDDEFDESHPFNFLNNLANQFLPSRFMKLTPGMTIYRARSEKKNKVFQHKDLTSPPIEDTKNRRMSPVGVSFFYGSMDEDTCISEVRADKGKKVAVAEYEVLNALNILDLSEEVEEEYKSIFNEEYYYQYEEYYKPLIKHFVAEIAIPIESYDKGVEYIPTQVFTEFITLKVIPDLYLPNTTYKIDGIMFRSSLKEDGINIVLFKGPDISTEDIDQDSDAWLHYKGFKWYPSSRYRFFKLKYIEPLKCKIIKLLSKLIGKR